MEMFPRTRQLLNQVYRRMAVQRLGRRAYRGVWILGALAMVWLLISRLTGTVPDFFTTWWIAAVPALAALIALIIPLRIEPSDVARQVDRSAGSHDLFLTTTWLHTAAGGYQKLVQKSAEEQAAISAYLAKNLAKPAPAAPADAKAPSER